jgi:hypothetical protein
LELINDKFPNTKADLQNKLKSLPKIGGKVYIQAFSMIIYNQMLLVSAMYTESGVNVPTVLALESTDGISRGLAVNIVKYHFPPVFKSSPGYSSYNPCLWSDHLDEDGFSTYWKRFIDVRDTYRYFNTIVDVDLINEV